MSYNAFKSIRAAEAKKRKSTNITRKYTRDPSGDKAIADRDRGIAIRLGADLQKFLPNNGATMTAVMGPPAAPAIGPMAAIAPAPPVPATPARILTYPPMIPLPSLTGIPPTLPSLSGLASPFVSDEMPPLEDFGGVEAEPEDARGEDWMDPEIYDVEQQDDEMYNFVLNTLDEFGWVTGSRKSTFDRNLDTYRTDFDNNYDLYVFCVSKFNFKKGTQKTSIGQFTKKVSEGLVHFSDPRRYILGPAGPIGSGARRGRGARRARRVRH